MVQGAEPPPLARPFSDARHPARAVEGARAGGSAYRRPARVRGHDPIGETGDTALLPGATHHRSGLARIAAPRTRRFAGANRRLAAGARVSCKAASVISLARQ